MRVTKNLNVKPEQAERINAYLNANYSTQELNELDEQFIEQILLDNKKEWE